MRDPSYSDAGDSNHRLMCVPALVALLLLVTADASTALATDFDAVSAEAASRQRAMDYVGALAVLEPAIDEARTTDSHGWQGRLLTQRAMALANAGSLQRARESLRQAIDVFARLDDDEWQPELLVTRGALDLLSGNPEQSLQHWTAAATTLRADDRLRRASEVEADLASAFAQRAPEQAIDLVSTVERDLDSERDPHLPRLLGARAYALQTLERRDEALAAYDHLIPLAWQHNDQQTLRFAYCNRADLLRRLGRFGEAADDLERAVAGFENGRRVNALSGPERTAFLERQIDAYERWILLLLDSYRGDQAFDIAERFHARTFLDMLEERDLDRAIRASQPLREREKQLFAQLASVQERQESQGAQSPDLARELERAVARLREHQALVRSQEPRYADLVAPRAPSQDEIRAHLESGEALIAYWRTPDRLVIWTLVSGAISTTQVPLGVHELEQALDEFLEPLLSSVAAEQTALRGNESTHLETGQKLYSWLLGALPKEVLAAQRWIIVRHGELNRLPFEALPTGCDGGQGQHTESKSNEFAMHLGYRGCGFVGLEKELLYAPSATSLLRLRSRRKSTKTRAPLLVLAPFDAPEFTDGRQIAPSTARANLGPLPHAREEAEALSRIIPETSLQLGENARESVFKRDASRAAIVHVATHGLIDDHEPMASALYLVGDDVEDGLLLAGEVLGLELDADLVTLSACRTARGRLRRGEGFVGLQQAFLYAGASSVLASMWDVDDEATLLFMRPFYRALADGAAPAAALLAARRALFEEQIERRVVLRERPVALAHPRFWAAFALTGAR